MEVKRESVMNMFNLKFLYAVKALQEMENLRKIDVSDSINERALKLIQAEETFGSRMDEAVKLCKKEMDIKKLKSKINESNIQEDDLVVSHKILDLILRHTNIKSKDENKAVEDNLKIEEDELKKQCIQTIYCDCIELQKQIINSFMRCRNRETLITTPDFRMIQELDTDLSGIIEKTKSGNIDNSDLENYRIVLKWGHSLADKLRKLIDQINSNEDITLIQQQKPAEVNKERKQEINVNVEECNAAEVKIKEDTLQLRDCSCQECLDYYLQLCDKVNETAKWANIFLSKAPKDLIRNLKIAINTPVNSLSSESALHMLDKFTKISFLLQGNIGMLKMNAHNIEKESLIPFVTDYLSQRFVSHAEKLLVPAKPEDAFCLASIIVALWNEFPDFGSVVMGYIMKKCPYTIPAYWPQYKGQSDKDYYISRGYQYISDGSIEDQNSFLKRMTGIFMLYAAIIITVPRQNKPHPYGLQNGWRWIAAIINLEPRSDITAALIHTFLKMCGFKLVQFYGVQFWKIMHLLNHEYFVKIEKVTSTDFRGPVARLKEYFENVLRCGCFRTPEGLLSATNW